MYFLGKADLVDNDPAKLQANLKISHLIIIKFYHCERKLQDLE